jgi:diguanylate cyclase (GGDEF)-like protein/PAS domain S-box-containing protein
MRWAEAAFRHMREGLLVTSPDGIIVEVNAAFTRITGYTRDEAVGRSPSMLHSGRQDANFYGAMWRDLQRRGSWQGEVWNRHKNGEVYAERLSIFAVQDKNGRIECYVGLFSDVTSKTHGRDELARLAYHDALTGLPNRRLLLERLQRCVAEARRRRRGFAVVFLDLDGFKDINDLHGHACGDELLVALSERLQHCVRKNDTVARLGGDEFVVLLEHLGGKGGPLPLVTRLQKACAAPVECAGQSLRISASIGMAIDTGDGEADAEELLRRADQAMYRAKRSGKDRCCVFELPHVARRAAANGSSPSGA